MGRLPQIEQIIAALMSQIVVGKAHLIVAKGLAESDPVVLNAAKTFFAITIDSHIYSAQMHAARLYDTTHGAMTVRTLLNRADNEAGRAKYGTADEVRKALVTSEKAISALVGPLKALTTRRNSYLAHTDPRTLTDPVKMAASAKINFPDLERTFSETGKVVNEFSRLFRDVTSIIDLIDQTDYETVIDFVSKVKCEQVRQYEAEFSQPAPFPRPKGCK
jgi:hypothetical protein